MKKCINCPSFLGFRGRAPFCKRCKRRSKKLFEKHEAILVKSIDKLQTQLQYTENVHLRHATYNEMDNICGKLIELRSTQLKYERLLDM